MKSMENPIGTDRPDAAPVNSPAVDVAEPDAHAQPIKTPKRPGSRTSRKADQAVAQIEDKLNPSSDAGAIPPQAPGELAPAIEALLLSVDRPLTLTRIGEALGLIRAEDDDLDAPNAPDADAHPLQVAAQQAKAERRKGRRGKSPTDVIAAAIDLLNTQYAETGRSFRIEKLAGGYRVMTLPEFTKVIEAYHGKRERQAISRAAIETLAIVAYKQPITRATLEAIRGVACGEVLRSLTERRLVTMVGRAEEVGRPILYGTTKQFLEAFGLSSARDLPTVDELKARGGPAESED